MERNKYSPIKPLVIHLPFHIKNRLMHKIDFFELNVQDVVGILIQRFINGDFDEDFSIPKFKK
jgi:hypothetical protein